MQFSVLHYLFIYLKTIIGQVNFVNTTTTTTTTTSTTTNNNNVNNTNDNTNTNDDNFLFFKASLQFSCIICTIGFLPGISPNCYK